MGTFASEKKRRWFVLRKEVVIFKNQMCNFCGTFVVSVFLFFIICCVVGRTYFENMLFHAPCSRLFKLFNGMPQTPKLTAERKKVLWTFAWQKKVRN